MTKILERRVPSSTKYRTLIKLPSTSSHASLSEEERRKQCITDSLLRLSVGVEDTKDLLRDIEAAIALTE